MSLSTEEVNRIVTHMNEDHADSVLAYVQYYSQLADAQQAELLDVDLTQMRILAHVNGAEQEVAIPFSEALTCAKDAHMTMVQMSKEAKAALK